jgi:tyrosyl-tRNA synthetase
MPINFVEELTWRGMIHDMMPGVEEHLTAEMRTAYVGFDPTADSLHLGNLVPIMLLAHFQRAGHKPIALVGGATGMIGDPSGKSSERNLLDEQTLQHNLEAQKKQLAKFLDFNSRDQNRAELVNNYDWMKPISFLEFIRDVGKHITVNYMMAKDSVKNRIAGDDNTGMSFTEFSYQLVQGYDFLHLYRNEKCSIQMGGSDQWGNITTGTELIRRMDAGKAFAITCPLITKADGTKFGKSEGGNVWLDPEKTSPYKFYQYWLNTSDEDAAKYIKIFTFLGKDEIEQLIVAHNEAPHLRELQRALAAELTKMVHSEEDLNHAIVASNILFGKSTAEDLQQLNEKQFNEIFDGVKTTSLLKSDLNDLTLIDALVGKGGFLSSNKEAARDIAANAISVNKTKVDANFQFNESDLIGGKYILLGKGKKTNFILKFE